jgi:hypothetical protein
MNGSIAQLRTLATLSPEKQLPVAIGYGTGDT